MGSTFNPQILVDKLSKLNSSQQSIETLSHWCIFHMNKAKQVVETWARQFHCSPREQRLSFLYLANDIIQNSRRKGAEFVAEFWKVLPDSLRDVFENGDENGRNSVMRLINIWEERKVFGSRGQILKDEFVKRPLDNASKISKQDVFKLRSPGGNALDKLVSGYQVVYGNQVEEDIVFNKCREAISYFEKVDKDAKGDHKLGELKEQHLILRDCIEQLAAIESSRTNLVSLLREALQEEDYKLGQVRDQLQVAHTRSEWADGICRQLLGGNGNRRVHGERSGTGNPSSQAPPALMAGPGEQSTSVIYTRQASFAEESGHIEEAPKPSAAEVAEKLVASTSSAQMLSLVLSSLASEGVIVNPVKELSKEYPSEKRAKFNDGGEHPNTYILQNSQAPSPPFSHAGQNLPISTQELTPSEPPPPPPPLTSSSSSPPGLAPLQPPMQQYPMPQFLQTAMPLLNGAPPYGYGMNQQQLPAVALHSNYSTVGAPGSEFNPLLNVFQSYQPAEGSFYGQGQASTLPMAPMNQQ